jgi:hypothetical protein
MQDLAEHERVRWTSLAADNLREVTCNSMSAFGHATIATGVGVASVGALAGGIPAVPGLVIGIVGASVVLISWGTDATWRILQTTPHTGRDVPSAMALAVASEQDPAVSETLASYFGLPACELLWSLRHDITGLQERTGIA